jgi:uncharacterized membrane protein YdjX (TVP38/TMEM64 family)
MRHLKIILLGLFLLACLVLVHIPAVHNVVGRWASLGPQLRGHGWAAGPAFAVLTAVLVVLGMPRLALCAFAGLAFGFLRGLLWAEAGTLLGACATFCFVRWAGRDTIMRKWPALERCAERLGRNGWATVLLARIMPVNTLLADAALALTPVTRCQFLLGTAVGLLPEAVPVTLIGAGIGQKALLQSAVCVLIGAVLLGTGGLLVMKWRRRIGDHQELGLTTPMGGCADKDNAA